MCPHNKRVYSLYLSTLISSGLYKCDKTDLASCKWNIDWGRIFPADTNGKDCIVRLRLVSKDNAASTMAFDANIGTVRANFSSVYQNSLNGVILATLVVTGSPDSASDNLLSADTLEHNSAVRIKVPNGNAFFNIFLMDMSETLLTSANLVDWQIEFNFEIIE
jgi:hypothetical protein